MIHSNKLAYYMLCRNINNFWKDIAIHNKSKSTLSNCIDGTTGKLLPQAYGKIIILHYGITHQILLIKKMAVIVLKTCVSTKGCMFLQLR